jgi:hypothetical protein
VRISTALDRLRPSRSVVFSVVGIGAAFAALVFATTAFANEPPRLTKTGATTTERPESTVTLTCPRGYTATGVSAEIDGFAGVTISGLWPDGRKAYARAHATRPVTAPWALRARAVCVRGTADIEYARATQPASAPPVQVICPGGKELIGMGWAATGGARIMFAIPAFGAGGTPPGTGTGGFPTGTGGFPTGTGGFPTGTGGFPTGTGGFPTGTGGNPTGTGGTPGPGNLLNGVIGAASPGGQPAAAISVTAVCATPGHNSGTVVSKAGPDPRGNSETRATCPRWWYAQASGLVVQSLHGRLGEVRAQTISENRRSGRLVVDDTTHGIQLHLLCAQ